MITCPNCGVSHQLKNDYCRACDTVFYGEDVLEMHRLQYLLDETESWPGVDEAQRAKYRERLELLSARLKKTEPAEPEIVPESRSQPQVQAAPPTPVTREKPESATGDVESESAPVTPSQTAAPATVTFEKVKASPKEKVPFDQWLLSERNIKVALYTGGLLLILAGLIFVGANWANIPGPGKFAITVLITGLTYLGGFHLCQRETFRLGGNALLFLASGFLILNFVVLQIYVLGPMGLHDDTMWLIASLSCMLIYMFTAYATRSEVFTYFSIAALGIATVSALAIINARGESYLLALAILALVLIGIARVVQSTQFNDYTRKPITISAHAAMAFSLLVIFFERFRIHLLGRTAVLNDTDLLLISLSCLMFYMFAAYAMRLRVFTYISLAALGFSVTTVLRIIDAPGEVYLLTLSVLALLLLWLAQTFQSTEYSDFTKQPIIISAHAVMAFSFLTVFLAVFQVILLDRPAAFDEIVMLMSSITSLIFYMLVAYSIRLKLFTYISLAAFGISAAMVLMIINAPAGVYLLALSILALLLLELARAVQSTQLGDFTTKPFSITAHGAIPLTVIIAFARIFSTGDFGAVLHVLELAVAFLGVIFYVRVNAVFKTSEARWAAAALFALTAFVTLIELGFTQIGVSVVLMLLALSYLGLGFLLERMEGAREGGWPLYVIAYLIACFTTVAAFYDVSYLAMALVADVILLLASAAVFSDYRFVTGAVWLFIIPVNIYLSIYLPSPAIRGVVLGILGLNYFAAGYALGRKELRLGAPFLVGAVAISILSGVLTWSDPVIATTVLAVIALLFLFSAVWLRWNWLLLPSLLAVNLAVVAVNTMFFSGFDSLGRALTNSFTAIGAVSVVAAYRLKRAGKDPWAWPLYFAGAVELIGSYSAGLMYGGWLMVGVSFVVASVMLVFAWLERSTLEVHFSPAHLTTLGLIIIYLSHFHVIGLLGAGGLMDIWPVLTISVSALYVILSWRLRFDERDRIYGTPLRRVGLWTMPVPIIFACNTIWPLSIISPIFNALLHNVIPASSMHLLAPQLHPEPFLGILIMAVSGLVFVTNGRLGQTVYQVYMGMGFFLVGLVGGITLLDIWPVLLAVLSALFVISPVLLRRENLVRFYGIPLRRLGMWLMLLPLMVGASMIIPLRYFFEIFRFYFLPHAWTGQTVGILPPFVSGSLYGFVIFAVAGLSFMSDGRLRRSTGLTYLGFGFFVPAIWALLNALTVYELQAYIIPPGLMILGIGWNQRRLDKMRSFRILTSLGLLVLLGSVFVQAVSRGFPEYTLLLALEGAAALTWGIRTRIRRYVQVGVLALVAGAVIQVGPAFIEAPRWIQIGITGAVLFGGGMAALFKREQIMTARDLLKEEWRKWES